MTNTEFKQKLSEAFQSHTLMKGREYHTINELLYVIENTEELKKENCNIAIRTLDQRSVCIPCMDAFVDIKTRGIWFNDADIEYEVDEYEGTKFGCVTVYERKTEETEWFGKVRWCEADLEEALRVQGYPVTENNISRLYDICKSHWFTDHMISSGWEYIYDQIGYGNGWDEPREE